jgi:hypothetical protein
MHQCLPFECKNRGKLPGESPWIFVGLKKKMFYFDWQIGRKTLALWHFVTLALLPNWLCKKVGKNCFFERRDVIIDRNYALGYMTMYEHWKICKFNYAKSWLKMVYSSIAFGGNKWQSIEHLTFYRLHSWRLWTPRHFKNKYNLFSKQLKYAIKKEIPISKIVYKTDNIPVTTRLM